MKKGNLLIVAHRGYNNSIYLCVKDTLERGAGPYYNDSHKFCHCYFQNKFDEFGKKGWLSLA